MKSRFEKIKPQQEGIMAKKDCSQEEMNAMFRCVYISQGAGQRQAESRGRLRLT
jgi:hypothetical protein